MENIDQQLVKNWRKLHAISIIEDLLEAQSIFEDDDINVTLDQLLKAAEIAELMKQNYLLSKIQ